MKRYELLVDIYQYHYDGQDPDSGGMLYHYDYENPVVTKATGGSIKPFESLESFGPQYRNAQMVQLYMPYRPSLRDRLGRIRNKAGEVQFIEPDGDSTEFEIFGVFPQEDMNGRTVDYRVICMRGTIQA
ncbi:hypothetical protein [Streptomyces rubiginosohelvolus]|uniref:hypothetical protein n=1 Tax=Streptomyces rubiginosohelvolus TaxID=67362 RepID=UPI0036F1793C